MPSSASERLPSLTLALCLALAPAAAAAQGAGEPAASATRAIGAASVGLRPAPDGFRGGGPDYRVELDSGGMRFTPALGPGAERTFPVAFELESVSVGGIPLPCAAAPPEAAGTTVLYRRGGGLTERYELGAAGVEQSFVFETLPAGRGEVVVRGRLATELPLAAVDARGGLVLEHPGLGGVRYGGVTGVDADGSTAAGWLHLADGVLELGLPADFVATAALPLVLDPLLIPLIPLATSSGPDDDEVDVAFEETGGYLVVWGRTFAAGETEIRGQLVDEEGNLDGGLLLLSGNDQNTRPAVGSIESDHTFIVAWEHRSTGQPDADIQACAVDGDDGLVTGAIEVGVTGADELEPDVGRDWSTCPLVWRNTASGLAGALIDLDVSGEPFVSSSYTVTQNSLDRSPMLSASGVGQQMLVWVRDSTFLSDAVRGQRYITHPAGDGFLIHTSLNQLSSPVCAMGENDDDAMVVWTSADLFGLEDIYAKRVTFPDSDPVVGPLITVKENPAKDDRLPAIAYAKHEYVVAFIVGEAAGDSVKAVALDPMTGERLEIMDVTVSVELTSLAVAGTADGSSADEPDLVLIALTDDTGLGGDVLAALAEGFAGSQDPIFFAGCAGAGSARGSAFHSPNPGHREELWDAPAGLDAFLGIGWTPFSLALGAATLYVDPVQSIVLYAGTVGADGTIGLDVPLPAGLAGASLWFQWALLPSGAPCTPLGVDLSGALEAVVE